MSCHLFFFFQPKFGCNKLFMYGVCACLSTFTGHKTDRKWRLVWFPGYQYRICVQITMRDMLSTPTISISTSIRPTESVHPGCFSTLWWEMVVGGKSAVITKYTHITYTSSLLTEEPGKFPQQWLWSLSCWLLLFGKPVTVNSIIFYSWKYKEIKVINFNGPVCNILEDLLAKME